MEMENDEWCGWRLERRVVCPFPKHEPQIQLCFLKWDYPDQWTEAYNMIFTLKEADHAPSNSRNVQFTAVATF